jgi:hypothetical protein
MEYITGIHALSLNCSLDTSGDWHTLAIQWHTPNKKNTKDSIWLDYEIETNSRVPGTPGTHYAANHIRACLDLTHVTLLSLKGCVKILLCLINTMMKYLKKLPC